MDIFNLYKMDTGLGFGVCVFKAKQNNFVLCH